MRKKAAFVIFQIFALLSVLTTIAVIAVSSISSESNYNKEETGNSGEVAILESNQPTQSSAPIDTPSQNSDPNLGSQIDMSRYGKTNEDSPLYQQCMQELNAERSGLVNLQSQSAQYSAEHNDLIARIQASTDPVEIQNLTASADVKMQQLWDSYAAVTNYQNAHPYNWSCGWSGKFYF